VDRQAAENFLGAHNHCVLITLRRDGRPQSSNVVYTYTDGLIRISVTADRAKTRNLMRDPRASVHVNSDDFWQYVVADGAAELSTVSIVPGDEVGRELAEINEAISGEPHPNWGEFHQAMVDDQRLVIRLRPDHFYGQVR
jgi:PPOX class probable F420-dependent enzyme